MSSVLMERLMSSSFEFTGSLNRRLLEYARKHNMTPNEALRIALGLLFVSDKADGKGYDIAVTEKGQVIETLKGLPSVRGTHNG